MHRIVLACACLVGGCFFEADYRSGAVRCSDGKCPSGLACIGGTCLPPNQDAAVDAEDAAIDAMPDAPVAALTCVQPGLLDSAGDTASGSTTGRSSTVSAMCGGFVMNGPDAVYRIDTAASDQLVLSISGSYPVNAYVLAPCSAAPTTPMCLTNMAASQGNPISVTTTMAGNHWIVVDGPNAAQSGSYTLTVTVN